MRVKDLILHESLTIVDIDGYEPGEEAEQSGQVDPPGSANFLVNELGFYLDLQSKSEKEVVLWTDYDIGGRSAWLFSILIDSADLEAVREACQEHGYDIVEEREVTEPINFGDGGGGTVEILKHRDGWIVLD
jgi:hypothetical protein